MLAHFFPYGLRLALGFQEAPAEILPRGSSLGSFSLICHVSLLPLCHTFSVALCALRQGWGGDLVSGAFIDDQQTFPGL